MYMYIHTYRTPFQVTVDDLKAHTAHSFAWVPPFHSIFQHNENNDALPFQVVPAENRAHGGFLCVQPVPSHVSADSCSGVLPSIARCGGSPGTGWATEMRGTACCISA